MSDNIGATASPQPAGQAQGRTYSCDKCGVETPAYWTRCEDCRRSIRLANATEVEDEGGPYFEFYGERFYYDLSDAAEDGVAWVSPCTITYPRLNAESVLETLLDDMHEDASVHDLDGVEAFRAAVDAFNEAQTTRSYWADEKRKIRVPAIAAGSGTAETSEAQAQCGASQSGAESASPNPSISSQGS